MGCSKPTQLMRAPLRQVFLRSFLLFQLLKDAYSSWKRTCPRAWNPPEISSEPENLLEVLAWPDVFSWITFSWGNGDSTSTLGFLATTVQLPPSSSSSTFSAYSYACNFSINWGRDLNAALRNNITYGFRLFNCVSHIEHVLMQFRELSVGPWLSGMVSGRS